MDIWSFARCRTFHTGNENSAIWRVGASPQLEGTGAGEFIPVATADSGLVISGDATGLSATDPHSHASIDFASGDNNRCLQAFVKQAAGGPAPRQVADLARGV